jgi:hypothetical protein
MKANIKFWILLPALAIGALAAAWSWPATPLYRGYLAGRASGAMLFSMVQALGIEASLHAQSTPAGRAACPRGGFYERLHRLMGGEFAKVSARPRCF